MWSTARPGVATTTCDAALEDLELVDDRLAAVDGQHVGVELAAVLVDGLGDLDGQLAGGDQDERERARRWRRARCARGSAGRTPPSCRCRWRPGRAGRGRPMTGGIDSAWIGVGSSYPRVFSASRSSTRRPRSAKVVSGSSAGTSRGACASISTASITSTARSRLASSTWSGSSGVAEGEGETESSVMVWLHRVSRSTGRARLGAWVVV